MEVPSTQAPRDQQPAVAAPATQRQQPAAAEAASPPKKGCRALSKAALEALQQRNRAIAHIIKHAGAAYAKDAVKMKWVVDLTRRVDAEVRADGTRQAAQLTALQQQLAALEASSAAAAQEAQRTQQQLQQQVQQQALDLYNSRYMLAAAQQQAAEMQEVLCHAQEAATAATQECATLAAAVQAMVEQDARARSSLAHRAHALKQQLLQTHAALRRLHDSERKQTNQKEVALRTRERALAAEHAELLQQQEAHQARDAALENITLKYHTATQRLKQLQTTCEAVAGVAAAPPSGSDIAAADQPGKHQQCGSGHGQQAVQPVAEAVAAT